MRIVVTGYRHWSVARTIFEVMDAWLEWPYHKNVVATGGCPTGADAYAGWLARNRGVPLVTYRADWSLGNKAGPIRNKYMIDHFRPDLVLAFLHPQGRGTQQCVQYAVEQGYRVIRTWA